MTQPRLEKSLLSGLLLLLAYTHTLAGPGLVSPELVFPAPASASGVSFVADVSRNGRYIANLSEAANLVASASSRSVLNLYLHDRESGESTLVTRRLDGDSAHEPTLSAVFSQDSRYLVFESLARALTQETVAGLGDVYRYDLQSQEIRIVSIDLAGRAGGNGLSKGASVSADGSRIVFLSEATNLVGQDNNHWEDIFVRDLNESTTHLVTVNYQGTDSAIPRPQDLRRHPHRVPSMSSDGRFVVFTGSAEDLVPEPPPPEWSATEIYLRDLDLGTTLWVSASLWEEPTIGSRGDSFRPVVAGNHVFFLSCAGDLEGPWGKIASSRLYRWSIPDRVLTPVFYDPDGVFVGVDDYQTDLEGEWVAYASLEDRDGVKRFVRLWEAPEAPAPVLSVNITNGPVAVPHSGFGLSDDKRRFTFLTQAPVLDEGIASSGFQLYQRDRVLDEFALISRSPTGDRTDAPCADFAIDSTGTIVAFDAGDGDLVALDRNKAQDVFLWEVAYDFVSLLSEVDPDKVQETPTPASGMGTAALSDDGRFVAFTSMADGLVEGDSNGHMDVFLRDRETGVTTAISVTHEGTTGNRASWSPLISPNGRFVAFYSFATNLVGGDSNTLADYYVRDTLTGATELVSANESGLALGVDRYTEPLMSPDGYWVGASPIKQSWSDDQRFVLLNLQTGARYQSTLLALGLPQKVAPRALSSTGTVLYEEQSSTGDVLALRSVEPGMSEPASSIEVSTTMLASTPGGDCVAFHHRISQLGSLQLLDLGTQEQIALSPTNLALRWPPYRMQLSDNGSTLAFTSASNLVSLDQNVKPDVYCLDRHEPGVFELISVTPNGSSGNGISGRPSISADGRFVAFKSFASDLVAGDTNDGPDVFLRDRVLQRTWLLSVSEQTTRTGQGSSNGAQINADGSVVSFVSNAGDLASGDFNRNFDFFAWQLPLAPIGDSDGDLMEDDWELLYFGGFHRDGHLDADGDGLTDLDEFRVATAPGDSASVWRLTLTVRPGLGNELEWDGTSDQSFLIEYKDELLSPEWQALPGFPASAGPLRMRQADPSPPSQHPRYYRVVLLP